MSDPQTIAAYEGRVSDYAALGTASEPTETLRAFIADLPAGAAVLDLGCGPGTDAAHMVSAGLAVTAIDACPGFVDAARAKGVDARPGTFDDVTEHAAFDGIWASFSLLHAPRSEMPRHLAALGRALRPEGVLHLSLKTGEGEGRDALGRFYTYYSEDAVDVLLAEAGFTPFRKVAGAEAGLAGTVEPWIAITARHG